MDIQVNFIAVFCATIASMIIGYVWYAPFGFGDIWTKLAKIDPKRFNTGVAMASAIVSSFGMALGLAFATYVVTRAFGQDFLYSSLWTGVFVFSLFQGLRMFMRAQFNQDTYTETLIHIGNEFVVLMSMSLIIGAFGL